jgi:hypothetical protein
MQKTLICLLFAAASGAGVYVAAADAKAKPAPQLHLSAKKTIALFEGPNTVVRARQSSTLY